MNLLTIADALALRFAAASLTPPSGLKTVTTSTARPPNNIPNTPFVITWPMSGDVTFPPGQLLTEDEFSVIFYYSKAEGDTPREYVALMSWLGVLLYQLNAHMKLGVVGVKKAEIMKWEIGTHVYAGVVYEGITLTVHVWTEETVTLVP